MPKVKVKKKRPKCKLVRTQVTFQVGGGAKPSDGRDLWKWLCQLDDVGKGRIAQQHRE